jgi:hypothetical protein
MLRPDQIERLSPDQLVVAERWEKERAERAVILSEMEKVKDDWDQYSALLIKFTHTDALRCEHDRCAMSGCHECNEIQILLNPLFYDEEGELLPEEELKEAIASHPEIYHGDFSLVP